MLVIYHIVAFKCCRICIQFASNGIFNFKKTVEQKRSVHMSRLTTGGEGVIGRVPVQIDKNGLRYGMTFCCLTQVSLSLNHYVL